MTLDIFKLKGTPPEQQRFSWREFGQPSYSKLDDDAFCRIRVLASHALEAEAVRFGHFSARMNPKLQGALAEIRRLEHLQQTCLNGCNPPDQSPLETTLALEQTAIELTASVAQSEPDPYFAQVYRFGLLEDFDHLYRFAALYDRLQGGDANTLLQSHTNIMPGRPTLAQHRAPLDDLRRPYDRHTAQAVTKLNALAVVAVEYQTRDYYVTVGPMFADPTARQLYAEIASIEEQHVTQYESIIDPAETWLEKWLLHEASEVYHYWSCLESEPNPKLRRLWERFVDYELGHLHVAMALFEELERRDPAEVLPPELPAPIEYTSQRDFVREVLEREVSLRASGPDFVREPALAGSPSEQYSSALNADGSPSQAVAAGYVWWPGSELAADPDPDPDTEPAAHPPQLAERSFR